MPAAPRCLRNAPRLVASSGRKFDRHLAQSLAGSREDRVSYSGNDGRGAGLAHSARRLGTRDDVNLERRSLVDSQRLVRVEIALLDTAVLQGDLAVKGRSDAEHHRTLDLGLDDVGI